MMSKTSEKLRTELLEAKKKTDEVIKEMKNEIEKGESFSVQDWFEADKIKYKDIVFIFACPGKDEFLYGRPCYGQTGDNLDLFIEHLEKYLFDNFVEYKAYFTLQKQNFKEKVSDVKDLNPRYKYIILNSSDKVHFDALGNGTLPSKKEIQNKADNEDEQKINILKEAKLIFCFGKEAETYCESINNKIKQRTKIKGKVIKCLHLSNISLNIKYTNSNDIFNDIDTPEKRRKKRIELLFNDKKSEIYKILNP